MRAWADAISLAAACRRNPFSRGRCNGMRSALRMTILLLLPCLCFGCKPPSKGDPSNGEQKAATPMLAKPVIAPMAARERLLHDLEVQKQHANVRAGQMQSVIDSGR